MKDDEAANSQLGIERDVPSSDTAFLRRLGERVRGARSSRGMTRKILARDSGVSERYLAQLESGQGNISILLLRDVSRALDIRLESLLLDGPEPAVDLVHTTEFLRQLSPADLEQARQLLVQNFSGLDGRTRRGRIALLGMRGAGKSTLGARLAELLGVPFIELDRMIEQQAGTPLSTVFDLYGQSGFRRLERRCLDKVVQQHPRFVLATGGSLVSEPATFERLLNSCYCIWLKASPEDHMQRVLAQGDTRPMADNREAMGDLRRILDAREPLYRKADLTVDTSRADEESSVTEILQALRDAAAI